MRLLGRTDQADILTPARKGLQSPPVALRCVVARRDWKEGRNGVFLSYNLLCCLLLKVVQAHVKTVHARCNSLAILHKNARKKRDFVVLIGSVENQAVWLSPYYPKSEALSN